MTESPKERRMAENELIFREYNEQVKNDFDKLNAIAAEVGDNPLELDGDLPLFFYCECADENCKKRIQISPNQYNKIHKERDQFTILPGHEVSRIEQVIFQSPEYSVVKKFEAPLSADKLNPTDVENT